MTDVALEAPAKVNLFLRVLAREASGYHGLETLFCAMDLSDRLRLRRRARPGIDLEVRGPWDVGPDEDNLATRAVRAFRERARLSGEGVALTLEKRIPPGSGLGGGSSDAAAALRGMNRLFGMPMRQDELLRLAGELGSDVPFFLSPSPLALGWSRGQRLLALPPLPPAPVLVALPRTPSATGRAYARLAESRRREGDAAPDPRVLTPEALQSWPAVAELAVNDFEPVVLEGRPELRALLARLREAGAALALLSGSGSALFAVFRSRERAGEVRERLEEDVPDVQLRLTRTLEAWPTAEVEGEESDGSPP